MYGHIKGMAESVKKGIDAIEGCEGVIYQVREQTMGRRGSRWVSASQVWRLRTHRWAFGVPLVVQVQEPEPQLPLP